jgi:hypothetical protein
MPAQAARHSTFTTKLARIPFWSGPISPQERDSRTRRPAHAAWLREQDLLLL